VRGAKTPPGDPTPLATRAAALLRARTAEVPVLPQPGERERSLAAIEQALQRRGQRRRRTVWLGIGAVAAAAGLLLWVGLRATVPPAPIALAPRAAPAPRARPTTVDGILAGTATVQGRQGSRAAEAGTIVEAGERLNLSHGSRLLATLASGARATLAGSLELLEAGPVERLSLVDGGIELVVPKLGPRQRLLVQTADSEVEVRGTRFTVAVASAQDGCVPATRTRVTVDEGAVVVRHAGVETRLLPGERWPACDQPALVGRDERPKRAARSAEPARIAAPARTAKLAEEAPTSAASTLAEQNDLFASAVAARRRGDRAAAVARLDDLLGRFPGGPLAGAARAERRSLLEPAVRRP
jgi:ferric-dicitrate binding protein FerR (iron transport regulator)